MGEKNEDRKGKDEPEVRKNTEGWRDERGRQEERVSESEVEEGGGRAGEEERERPVFMLVVTEVFIAPPTHGDGKREMGEGGCFVQKDEERESDG